MRLFFILFVSLISTFSYGFPPIERHAFDQYKKTTNGQFSRGGSFTFAKNSMVLTHTAGIQKCPEISKFRLPDVEGITVSKSSSAFENVIWFEYSKEPYNRNWNLPYLHNGRWFTEDDGRTNMYNGVEIYGDKSIHERTEIKIVNGKERAHRKFVQISAPWPYKFLVEEEILVNGKSVAACKFEAVLN